MPWARSLRTNWAPTRPGWRPPDSPAISWQIVVLIGALIPLSAAIQSSGAADRIADLVIDAIGPGRPYLLLLALFALTAALGQMVSNTATVLIVAPIAVAAARLSTTARPG